MVLSGYVQDARSGERLVGATLVEATHGTGTATNTYGFFSLSLAKGPAQIHVSYVGYRTDTLTVTLERDTQLQVELEPISLQLSGVEIAGDREARPSVSSIDVPIQQIQQVPALAGEVDVLKAFQLFPGVKAGTEGTSGLYVRGGGPDQNLILLDGTPVFNANHLFGFLSVFNADAIKHVELIKGGFPARYGGRLSSVLEITMKEGNMREHVVNGSIGLVSSKLSVEGPLSKDRTSFILSGRRTYFDLLARPFTKPEDGKPTAYFYDVSAKINHILSRRDRIYLSLYAGEDRFGSDRREFESESSGRIGWGNTTTTFRWNHLWSPKLFVNTTLTYSDFDLAVKLREKKLDQEPVETTASARYDSGINAFGARTDMDWIPAPRHYVRTGVGATQYRFSPGALELRGDYAQNDLDTALVSQPVHAAELTAYAEDDLQLGPSLKLNLGLHTSAFLLDGRSYGSLQPRLSALYALGSDWALRGALSTMQQYIHLLTHSSGLGLPTDLWVPSTERIPPQKAWQASLGATRTFRSRYEFSIEGYYKRMNGLIAYREGADYLTPGTDWQDLVTTGVGWSYGIELFVQRKSGRTTGWIGYTLARAMRRFDEIGFGRAFPDRYDRRHDVSFVLNRRVNRRFDVSMTWVYGTGNAVTLPLAYYTTYGMLSISESRSPRPEWRYPYYGERRNAFRMPAYHRLDLSASYFFARREGRENALTLSVYNAYNRKNPFYLETSTDALGAGPSSQLRGYTVFPVIPSVSYSFTY